VSESAYIEAFASACKPKDARSRAEWSEEYVRPPGSARSTLVDFSATPWLREPVDFSSDNRVREMVFMKPTGAGGTTIFDCVIPHATAEDPGGILLILQTDKDAREYVEERLMPIMRGAAPVAAIMDAMAKDAIRKDAVIFPHMPLYMSGANMTALQRRSVRYCLGDEVWRWQHGLVNEFRARHHDRWNARVILVSQGGMATVLRDEEAVDTELEAAWKRTDQREWCFQCPQCNEVQRFRMKALHYERAEDSRSALDENAVAQSAVYKCAGALLDNPTCDAVFEDKIQIRRGLANSGRYVIQNPAHLARHHGWHLNALTLYYVPWGTLAVEHAKAMAARKKGDSSPARIYRQKRLAENEREEESIPQTALTVGDYTFADYIPEDGKPVPLWDGEAIRIMTIDVQRDHFWAVLRAWKVDGSSRRLWAGKVNTMGALREMQQRYRIKDQAVYIDSKYDSNTVYNACGEFGWRALQGDQASSFVFPKQRGRHKFYSPMRTVSGTSGRPAVLIFWAVTPIKRILEKMRGGYRAPWEVERDMDPVLLEHLFSEIERDVVNKKTGAITRLFVRLKANHTWDCEAMQVVGALIALMLADSPDNADKPEAAEEKPETPA
jgi:hypothetical protein